MWESSLAYVVSSKDLIQYIYQQDTQEAIDKMAADVEAQKAKRDKFSRYMLLTISCFHLHYKFCKLQEAPPQPRQWHRLHQREEHEVQPEVREVLWRIYQGLFFVSFFVPNITLPLSELHDSND